jgi:hypothetical protein
VSAVLEMNWLSLGLKLLVKILLAHSPSKMDATIASLSTQVVEVPATFSRISDFSASTLLLLASSHTRPGSRSDDTGHSVPTWPHVISTNKKAPAAGTAGALWLVDRRAEELTTDQSASSDWSYTAMSVHELPGSPLSRGRPRSRSVATSQCICGGASHAYLASFLAVSARKVATIPMHSAWNGLSNR